MFCSQCGTNAQDADKYCRACGTTLPESPVRRPGHQSQTEAVGGNSRILAALHAYVGQNWESHYRSSFERLVRSRENGTATGWTWNWAAAIIPVWYLYRRLYLPFFGLLFLSTFINVADQVAAGTSDGGSPVALLFFGQLLAMGFAGDRVLFRKA